MPYDAKGQWSKRGLQIAILLLAAIPTAAGAVGCALGPGFLSLQEPWPADLDSHFRFLSGIFVVIGLGFYSCLRGIERKTRRFRTLAGLVWAGGLARLLSLTIAGAPSLPHLAGLGMELLVVPGLVLWQSAVARPTT